MKKPSSIVLIMLLASVTVFSIARFTDNGDGTIRDNGTGLVWQKCSIGHTVPDCTGSPAAYTWILAPANCTGLSLAGRSDWRLPNINELKSIIDYTKSDPAVNTSFFPGTQSSRYWSSTSGIIVDGTTDYKTYAMNVDFSGGYVLINPKSNSFYVRCVAGP